MASKCHDWEMDEEGHTVTIRKINFNEFCQKGACGNSEFIKTIALPSLLTKITRENFVNHKYQPASQPPVMLVIEKARL
jgi:hypothetical protein